MFSKLPIRIWKRVEVDKGLWSDQAQHGTVLIDTTEETARAVIVDDHSGVRAVFKLPTDKIDEVIGAAAEKWFARRAGGSFAVYSTGLKGRGVITPPPPPPPGPGGHERLFMMQTLVAHTAMEAAMAHARLGTIEDLKQPPLEVERLIKG
jgi:hypothetical protein